QRHRPELAVARLAAVEGHLGVVAQSVGEAEREAALVVPDFPEPLLLDEFDAGEERRVSMGVRRPPFQTERHLLGMDFLLGLEPAASLSEEPDLDAWTDIQRSGSHR